MPKKYINSKRKHLTTKEYAIAGLGAGKRDSYAKYFNKQNKRRKRKKK